MKDQRGNQLYVKPVAYSSVVGQSLIVQAGSGRVVGQISLLQFRLEKEQMVQLAADLAAALNRADITLPDPAR